MDSSPQAHARRVGVHYFTNSGDAYDSSQCLDHIRDGDVLVVNDPYPPFEKSVAILMHAWPIAVNEGYVTDKDDSFRFDSPEPGKTLLDVIQGMRETFHEDAPDKYDESIRVAREELAKLG